MFQAIVTKYLGPTDRRGSRVKATADAGSVTLSWDSSLTSEANHRKAALALCAKVGWYTAEAGKATAPIRAPLYGGGLPNSSGYAFVFGE